jgi:hypothetical protein
VQHQLSIPYLPSLIRKEILMAHRRMRHLQGPAVIAFALLLAFLPFIAVAHDTGPDDGGDSSPGPFVTRNVWLPLAAAPGVAAESSATARFEIDMINSRVSPIANAPAYEVWVTDQNNTAGFGPETPRGTHGGRILIYDGAELDNPTGPINDPEVIELSTYYAVGGPNNTTGTNVVRPHMALPSLDNRFLAVAFVTSGHVGIIEAATRSPKALFRMSTGSGGARQAHAAFWTPSGNLVVANQNGKLLERIVYNKATDSFSHDTAATLNLATCTTPSGLPCQTATPVSDTDPTFWGPNNRPDNAPICPIISARGHAFVTLRGGGLFVVDVGATPMAIVAAYGNQYVGRDGCGGMQDKKNVYLNGGAGTPATNISEFTLYHLRDEYPFAPNALTDNDPNWLPQVFFRDPSAGRDAHGMILTAGPVRYLWQLDRIANVAEVFRLPSRQHVATVSLLGPASVDPTPDLGALSPRGDRFYVALRGPQPQTGAHAATGSSPGLGIIQLTANGANGRLSHVLPTSFVSPANGSEESDPHAAAVILK